MPSFGIPRGLAELFGKVVHQKVVKDSCGETEFHGPGDVQGLEAAGLFEIFNGISPSSGARLLQSRRFLDFAARSDFLDHNTI